MFNNVTVNSETMDSKRTKGISVPEQLNLKLYFRNESFESMGVC